MTGPITEDAGNASLFNNASVAKSMTDGAAVAEETDIEMV